MKVTVTFLKAPWPQGTKVGDVIELVGFHGELPGWAKGKCTPAADDAEVAQVLERVAPAILAEPPKPAAVLLAEAEAKIAALTAELAETQAKIAELQGPAITGDGSGEALPTIEEPMATTVQTTPASGAKMKAAKG